MFKVVYLEHLHCCYEGHIAHGLNWSCTFSLCTQYICKCNVSGTHFGPSIMASTRCHVCITIQGRIGTSNTSVILKLTLVSLCVGVFLRGELLLQVMECLWKLGRPHFIFQPLKGFQKNSQALLGKTCIPLQCCLAESQSLSAAVWSYNIIEDIKITRQCCHYSLPLHLSCYFC